MSGAIAFSFADVYGTGFGTTEATIPEENDQMALVDDQKAAGAVSETGMKKVPIMAAVVLLIVVAFLMGVIKS